MDRKEDYLRTIYGFYEEGKGVKSADIAGKLGISKASVSEMLRKLAKENFLKIEKYGKIFLTAKGKRTAEDLYLRHYTVKKFVKQFLKYEDEKAIAEAHLLEHAFSDESIRKLREMLDGKRGGGILNYSSYIG